MNSAGLDAEAARLGSEIVSKVAKVTSGSGEQVGEVVGVVFNNLSETIVGDTREKIETIGDILTKTQFKFQIRDFGQLGESFAKGAKNAVRYKVALDQTATVLGQLNSAGVQGSLAGTSFNAILRQLGKASDDFGFSIERTSDGQLDLIKTIGNLKGSLEEFSDDIDERAAAVQQSFGDEGGAVSLLIDQYDKLTSAYKDVSENSRGLVDASYQKFLRSTPGQIDKLTKNFRVMSDTVIGTALPVLTALTTPVADLFGGIARLSAEFPAFGAVVGGVSLTVLGFVATAWAAKFAGTVLSDAWLMAKKTFLFFGKAMAFTRARLVAFNAVAAVTAVRTRALAMGSVIASFAGSVGALATRALPLLATAWRTLNIAFLTSPIGLIIGGLALGAGLIIANWDKVKTFFVGLWDTVSNAFSKFKDIVARSLGSGPLGILFRGVRAIAGFFSGEGQSGSKINRTVPTRTNVLGSNGATSSSFRTAQAVPVAVTPANENTPPVITTTASAPVSSGNLALNGNRGIIVQKLEINITPLPGQNPEAIAEMVVEKINASTGALFDAD